MKRCPQCEFIYEDDQNLCDMDGVLLVFDTRTLPNLHSSQTVEPKSQPKRNRAVPAFATVTLALVLGMVYYVVAPRKQVVDVPAATAASVANPAPVLNPTPEAQPSESVQPAPAAEEPKPITKPAAVTPAKKPITKSTSNQRKPQTDKKTTRRSARF